MRGLVPDYELRAPAALAAGLSMLAGSMAAVSLLDRHPAPSEEEIREGPAGNLCRRCTGYMRIFEAVRQVKS